MHKQLEQQLFDLPPSRTPRAAHWGAAAAGAAIPARPAAQAARETRAANRDDTRKAARPSRTPALKR